MCKQSFSGDHNNSDGLRTSKRFENGPTTKYLYNGTQLIGMDTELGTVYTNNPWGYTGTQTIDEFFAGFVKMEDNREIDHITFYSIS